MVALRTAAKEAGFERGAHGGFENYSLGADRRLPTVSHRRSGHGPSAAGGVKERA